jgi:hypothetical protein
MKQKSVEEMKLRKKQKEKGKEIQKKKIRKENIKRIRSTVYRERKKDRDIEKK